MERKPQYRLTFINPTGTILQSQGNARFQEYAIDRAFIIVEYWDSRSLVEEVAIKHSSNLTRAGLYFPVKVETFDRQTEQYRSLFIADNGEIIHFAK